MSDRKVKKDAVMEDTGPFHSISATFEAEKFPDSPLLDTYVELYVPRFAVTWNDRNKLVKEIAEVIRKYAI